MGARDKISAICQALNREIRDYNAFSMTLISEYGKVGGYDQRYAELKKDTLLTIELYSRINPTLSFADIQALPKLKPNRAMNELFFDHQKQTLLAAVERIAHDVATIDNETLSTALRNNFEIGAWLDYLLERSGVQLAPERLTDARKRIFVSIRYTSILLEQLRSVALQATLEPLALRHPLQPDHSSGEWLSAKRLLDTCGAGAISLIVRNTVDERSLATQLAPAMLEIGAAEAKYRDRLVLIARARDVEDLPDAFAGRRLFTVEGETLAPDEQTRLAELMTKEVWR